MGGASSSPRPDSAAPSASATGSAQFSARRSESGEHVAAGGNRKPRRRGAWLAGAAVLVGAAVVAAIVVVHDKSESAAEGPHYRDLTDECELVSTETLNKLVPGAVCKRSPTNPLNPDERVHMPSWTVESFTQPKSVLMTVRIASNAATMYARTKESLDAYGQQLTSPVSTNIAGSDLGPQVREAIMVSGVSRTIAGRADARLVFMAGTAVADVQVTGWDGVAASEAGVRAVATDIAARLK